MNREKNNLDNVYYYSLENIAKASLSHLEFVLGSNNKFSNTVN